MVSMKSGLRDRNNERAEESLLTVQEIVSMKSGLRDRNNAVAALTQHWQQWQSQ